LAEHDRVLFQQAVELHQSGDLQAAEPLYRRVLEATPQHSDARYLLGTVQLQLGQFAACIESLETVIAARPDVADAFNNLGIANQALGQWEAAAKAYQAAIKINPKYDQAFYNLGALMEARELFADAQKCYQHALHLNPDDVQCQLGLANVLKSQRKWPEAEACYREAAANDPRNLDVQVGLGFVLTRQERLDEAVDVYKQILDVQPDYHQVHNSLSYVYERQGQLGRALECARRTLEIQPDFAEGYNNLGTALCAQHRLDEACDCFRKALQLRQEFALAEFNLGSTQLLAGKYREGWPGYQRHAELLDTPPRRFTQPRWNGEPIADRKLLVYADQGFGDTIQFVRFLPEVKQRFGARIVFECPAELIGLLAPQVAVEEIIADGGLLPAFDAQIPLASLAGILDVGVDSVSADKSYLTAPQTLSSELQQLIEGVNESDLCVGLVWQGNPQQARDVVRSCPLEKFKPLLDMTGVSFFSLQTEHSGLAQLTTLHTNRKPIDLGTGLRDFSETAAVLSRLDLLVTVDTAVAHLAGALGRPVWTLLCHTPDWRWQLNRTDSAWYPSMRLFRQPKWGDWDAVIEQVSAELSRWARERARSAD
jgi:tetratricopeptide (TPR) repeat protein